MVSTSKILLKSYLPLPKHSNTTLDVCPLIATWLMGPRIISDCGGTGFLTVIIPNKMTIICEDY